MNRPIAFSGNHSDITLWSNQFGIPSHEARQRYAELSILGCIGFDRRASRSIVLKGGNALRFAYGGTRSTIDLDFTAVQEALEDEGEVLRELFNQAFSGSEASFQIRLRCQRVKRRPRDGTGTHPTYDIGVAYQFPTDRYYADFENKKTSRNAPTVIPVEVSLNDLVCETKDYDPVHGKQDSALLVCSLEDVIAEKLRSLLQQPIRNRNREQDVFDCVSFARSHKDIDREKVFKFFIQKCETREITPSPDSFDTTVREMAMVNYEPTISNQAPNDFIVFEEAWSELIEFVESLPWDTDHSP